RKTESGILIESLIFFPKAFTFDLIMLEALLK
ncbi:unnamed protein product, partial [marine sediment metagenome]